MSHQTRAQRTQLLPRSEWPRVFSGHHRRVPVLVSFPVLIPSCDLSEKYERMRKQVDDIGSRRITWPGSHELLLISPQKNSNRDCNWTHVRGAGSAGSSSIMPWWIHEKHERLLNIPALAYPRCTS